MIDWLLEIDRELFLWLNGQHAGWLDTPMALITGRELWIPFYLLLAAWLIFKQKKQAVWSILLIGLSVALADQFTSSLMKPFFERLRPCHDPEISQMVFTLVGCGGKYGFASSHASTTFSLAVFISLLHPGRTWLAVVVILWASLVSYSRIYVGVHYPGDILIGALCGTLIATAVFKAGIASGKLQQV